MSAEVLRRSASLMRERAEAASAGPWGVECDHLDTATGEGGDPMVVSVEPGVRRYVTCDADDDDATHIASWHPDVALAVADHLDLVARLLDQGFDENAETRSSLTVARAYLGGVA